MKTALLCNILLYKMSITAILYFSPNLQNCEKTKKIFISRALSFYEFLQISKSHYKYEEFFSEIIKKAKGKDFLQINLIISQNKKKNSINVSESLIQNIQEFFFLVQNLKNFGRLKHNPEMSFELKETWYNDF